MRTGSSVSGPAEGSSEPAELRIAAWNANSGIPADRGTNDGQLRIVREVIAGLDAEIVALSEVAPHWMDSIENRADVDGAFGLVRGTTGCNQRLAVLFDEARLEAIERHEMTGVLAENRCRRAPLLVAFRDAVTGSEFDVVAIHLTRGNRSEGPNIRAAEAMRLRRLLQSRGARPVVVIGDSNADCPVDTAPVGCAQAFYELVAGDFLEWVDFDRRVHTMCTARYDTMIDLAFVGRGAEGWAPDAAIVADADVCEAMQSGAHRPIVLTMTIPPAE